ncbi:hypothetical protein ACMT4L_19055 [Deinococcus sp. A31D244]|uniref:hypothetical protein n=1 Tax=Deinococcus sp. A31D244 TaxID=3397675 RepID=UPI0039DFE856
MALVNLGLAGIMTLVRRSNTLTNKVFATYKTPVCRFARPYSGKSSHLRLQPLDVLTMLRATGLLPVAKPSVSATLPAALHDVAPV